MNRTQIDCLVLSGGGAKGAYGAGAAKAILAYRKSKGIDRPVCYIGTSAGALNAVVLSACGPDALVDFWRDASKKRFFLWPKILGLPPTHWFVKLLTLVINPCFWIRLLGRSIGFDAPFALYGNRALRGFIVKKLGKNGKVNLDELLSHKHLIVAATNFNKGKIEAFYASKLVEPIIANDAARSPDKKRMTHFRKIENGEELIDALLASAAIPVAFPPVRIHGDWYVDGGLGNNTPTKEAALIMRELNSFGEYAAGETYCIVYDPPGTKAKPKLGPIASILRSYDILHYCQMYPVISSWHQINVSVRRNDEKVRKFEEFLDHHLEDQNLDTVRKEFQKKFESLQGTTPRLDLPFNEVRPSDNLGVLLDFRLKSIEKLIDIGYRDAVGMLKHSGKINEFEASELLERIHDRVAEGKR
jgi:predicted acylesterase/phospholipase RssA